MRKEGEIKVRALTEYDLETRVEWMNSPAIYETMHYEIPIRIENTRQWFLSNLSNPTRRDFVFEDENGAVVAMGGLTGIDSDNYKAELYIFVHPTRQGEGLGTRTTYLLCQFGFGVMGLRKIFLYTDSSNLGARKVYEKVGFKLEGCLRQENVKHGTREDRLYYGLFSHELKNLI